MRNLGTGIVWLNDGKLRRRDGHFDEFEAWSDGILAEENKVLHKMDRRIASETKWSREGISARRKRNQGRLRELANLRPNETRLEVAETRPMKMQTGSADGGGQLVLEAIDLSASVPTAKADPTKPTLNKTRTAAHLVATFQPIGPARSDRIGIVGPNGIGKSTPVSLLLNITKPDSGRVRHGFGLIPAYFDQRREALEKISRRGPY